MSTSIDEHGIPVYLFANKVEDAFAQQVHSHELSSISLYLGISGVYFISASIYFSHIHSVDAGTKFPFFATSMCIDHVRWYFLTY